ncbi:MAG: undecaprenyldiphospho-muramoylpentapeptide beta-N-acetylglucosaminyltransferase [Oscillospiraceae bacterium]|nr:undecaprenyldiphospho-muramoylpentapeptide beta-N-acetylglucosaminyltransferase [Oscillospiraceae bacterium]MBQ4538598.1 undecaprenyldiphospho-muramoylpentapeptide beta-N-acetylglucosaminyltransferase [Oscillospiraceae bacterium]
MKILFACGGTAGHINPALSVADSLCKRYPGTEVLFAGNPNGMEARLVPKAGYPFVPIEVAGIQRKINAKNIARNAKALWLLAKSGPTAARIIKDFDPDIVMGTGGYVSGPIVRKAHQLGYKTVTHEQNAFPGVTTKLLAPNVDRLLLAMSGAQKHLKVKDTSKVKVTGNPVREAVFTADRELSRMRMGIEDRVCLLSFGGSLGARRINEAIADVIKWHGGDKIHHIHATGSYDYEDFLQMLAERGIDPADNDHLDVREYIDNMPTCLAAADIVICRSGAITLSELQCAGKASILIPSPNVAENHQYHNAMELVERGAAEILEEKDLSGQSLIEMLDKLCEDKKKIASLGKSAAEMAIKDANQRIINEILELAAE